MLEGTLDSRDGTAASPAPSRRAGPAWSAGLGACASVTEPEAELEPASAADGATHRVRVAITLKPSSVRRRLRRGSPLLHSRFANSSALPATRALARASYRPTWGRSMRSTQNHAAGFSISARWRRQHSRRGALRCPAMSITVVGSIAYDSVKTPFGERERMLGGAAVHFALAASFFDEIRVVGPVGDDFGDAEFAVCVPAARRLRRRARRRRRDVLLGASTAGISTRARRWTHGSACSRPSSRNSRRLRASDVLFLANIQPDLQRDVREQCTARASPRSTR